MRSETVTGALSVTSSDPRRQHGRDSKELPWVLTVLDVNRSIVHRPYDYSHSKPFFKSLLSSLPALIEKRLHRWTTLNFLTYRHVSVDKVNDVMSV
jgi:hypothetical protein